MSKNTQNIGFVLPDANDFYDVRVSNENFEKADAELKELKEKKVDKVTGKELSTNDLTNELKKNYDAAHAHLSNTGNPHQTTAAQVGAIPTSQKGAASGVAELDGNGKVLSAQLPSYVDDVLEYASKTNFPGTGETGKIYVATNTNLTYRWTGSAYVEISPSLALGETSSTAYRGDKGKQNATDITALKNSLANLLTDETIEIAKAAGIDLTSGGGVLNLNRLVQLFLTNPVIESDVSGIWKYKKYADGTLEAWGKGTTKNGVVGNVALPMHLTEYAVFCSAPYIGAQVVYSFSIQDTSAWLADHFHAYVRCNAGAPLTTEVEVSMYLIGKWK